MNAPTIVRLLRFPTSLRLTRSGKEFRGPQKRSGPLVLSERHAPVVVTFRVSYPGVSFATGGSSVTGQEAFGEGEQRDLLLPWALVVDAKQRIGQILLEVDLSYEDVGEVHTATVPINLTYGVKKRVVVGAALAAAAVAVAASSNRKRKLTSPVKREEVVIAVPPVSSKKKAAPAKKKAAASKKATSSKKAAPSRKATPARKATSSKKTASKKSASKKTSSKKVSSKKKRR